MIMPRNMPPDAYIDDPAETIDRADRAESEEKLRSALASGALTCIGEWITRGRGGVTNRAFRADIVLLSISPQFLPCDYPNAAWVGRQHGVTRQRASELWREFADYIAPYVQFKGQRFLNQRNGSQKRRGRVRQGTEGPQPGPVAGAYFAMNLIAWFVIVPMSLAALATGLVQALATEWGLFRYYWVLGKLLLTIFATIVLLMKMPLVSYAARGAAETILPSATLRAVGMQLMVHAAGGILVLLMITTLSVVKPWGKTRYGRRGDPIGNASLMSLSAMLPDPGDATVAKGLFLGRKGFLCVIGVIVVAFVVHLVVFHLIGGSLHGH